MSEISQHVLIGSATGPLPPLERLGSDSSALAGSLSGPLPLAPLRPQLSLPTPSEPFAGGAAEGSAHAAAPARDAASALLLRPHDGLLLPRGTAQPAPLLASKPPGLFDGNGSSSEGLFSSLPSDRGGGGKWGSSSLHATHASAGGPLPHLPPPHQPLHHPPQFGSLHDTPPPPPRAGDGHHHAAHLHPFHQQGARPGPPPRPSRPTSINAADDSGSA